MYLFLLLLFLRALEICYNKTRLNFWRKTVGNFIELVFHRFFLGMIATAYFWLLTLAGGVVFGIAPASATLMSLFAENGYSYRAYRFKEAWALFKSNFVKSNLSFYTFIGIDFILIYGLYLMIQLPNQDRKSVV